jgi:hypothetical protein
MQTVNIEMPDGTTRELVLVDYTPEKLRHLSRSLNRLRGLAFNVVSTSARLPIEHMERINVIIGSIFGSRVMEFADGQDSRIKMATMLGPTFLPGFFSTIVEVCKFFGNRPDDLAALNNVTNAFDY